MIKLLTISTVQDILELPATSYGWFVAQEEYSSSLWNIISHWVFYYLLLTNIVTSRRYGPCKEEYLKKKPYKSAYNLRMKVYALHRLALDSIFKQKYLPMLRIGRYSCQQLSATE